MVALRDYDFASLTSDLAGLNHDFGHEWIFVLKIAKSCVAAARANSGVVSAKMPPPLISF